MAIIDEILGLPMGAVWLKADLHIHTPASNDISEKWKNSSPEDIVRIAKEKGLDIIAITDHNTAAYCDKVSEAAVGKNLTVFPGIEISTSQGHVLAIFDVGTPAIKIEDLLINLNFKREEFSSLDAATESGIVEVCEAIEKFGGIAIAAHIDAPRGFMELIKVGDEKERAYMAPSLRALEVKNASSRDTHQKGFQSPYSRRLACIQSSDCMAKGDVKHELDSMASRFSMLKMDERSLSGLKLALIDPEMRVRLPEDNIPKPDKAILGMWVTGGFLDGQKIRMSDNINCFIGDTGAGKSVALELLRFGLAQTPRVKKIQEEVNSLLEQQLGNLNTVHILIQKGNSQYLVERSWGDPPSQPIVTRLNKTGDEKLDDPIDMHLFFPIKAFSQSEIIEFAREPEVRLTLTDDLIDRTTEIGTINTLKLYLKENASKIQIEQSRASGIQKEINELPTLVEGKNNIDNVLKDPAITNHHVWYEEKTIFTLASEQFNNLSKEIDSAFSFMKVSFTIPEELDKFANQDCVKELKSLSDELHIIRESSKKDAIAKIIELCVKMTRLKNTWDDRFTKSEEEYKKLLAVIDKDGKGLEVLSEKRRTLQAQIIALEARKSELEKTVLPGIDELRKGRETLLTNLQEQRGLITSKREEKAKELSEKLENKIRLKVHHHSNKTEFRTALTKIGVGSGLREEEYDAISFKCHPISFVKFLVTSDFEKLQEQSGIAINRLTKFGDNIADKKRLNDLYELQLVDVDDVIEVMLKVGKDEYKPIESLAHGQKCMVVLMVALAEGDFPLLVDQPEDALHAPGIEEGIVATIRSRRGIRQCIFATRNANIIVSADAEQILALKSDAHHGKIVSCGCLDRFSQKELVIYHVEGGPEAFARRQRIYYLNP